MPQEQGSDLFLMRSRADAHSASTIAPSEIVAFERVDVVRERGHRPLDTYDGERGPDTNPPTRAAFGHTNRDKFEQLRKEVDVRKRRQVEELRWIAELEKSSPRMSYEESADHEEDSAMVRKRRDHLRPRNRQADDDTLEGLQGNAKRVPHQNTSQDEAYSTPLRESRSPIITNASSSSLSQKRLALQVASESPRSSWQPVDPLQNVVLVTKSTSRPSPPDKNSFDAPVRPTVFVVAGGSSSSTTNKSYSDAWIWDDSTENVATRLDSFTLDDGEAWANKLSRKALDQPPWTDQRTANNQSSSLANVDRIPRSCKHRDESNPSFPSSQTDHRAAVEATLGDVVLEGTSSLSLAPLVAPNADCDALSEPMLDLKDTEWDNQFQGPYMRRLASKIGKLALKRLDVVSVDPSRASTVKPSVPSTAGVSSTRDEVYNRQSKMIRKLLHAGHRDGERSISLAVEASPKTIKNTKVKVIEDECSRLAGGSPRTLNLKQFEDHVVNIEQASKRQKMNTNSIDLEQHWPKESTNNDGIDAQRRKEIRLEKVREFRQLQREREHEMRLEEEERFQAEKVRQALIVENALSESEREVEQRLLEEEEVERKRIEDDLQVQLERMEEIEKEMQWHKALERVRAADEAEHSRQAVEQEAQLGRLRAHTRFEEMLARAREVDLQKVEWEIQSEQYRRASERRNREAEEVEELWAFQKAHDEKEEALGIERNVSRQLATRAKVKAAEFEDRATVLEQNGLNLTDAEQALVVAREAKRVEAEKARKKAEDCQTRAESLEKRLLEAKAERARQNAEECEKRANALELLIIEAKERQRIDQKRLEDSEKRRVLDFAKKLERFADSDSDASDDSTASATSLSDLSIELQRIVVERKKMSNRVIKLEEETHRTHGEELVGLLHDLRYERFFLCRLLEKEISVRKVEQHTREEWLVEVQESLKKPMSLIERQVLVEEFELETEKALIGRRKIRFLIKLEVHEQEKVRACEEELKEAEERSRRKKLREIARLEKEQQARQERERLEVEQRVEELLLQRDQRDFEAGLLSVQEMEFRKIDRAFGRREKDAQRHGKVAELQQIKEEREMERRRRGPSYKATPEEKVRKLDADEQRRIMEEDERRERRNEEQRKEEEERLSALVADQKRIYSEQLRKREEQEQNLKRKRAEEEEKRRILEQEQRDHEEDRMKHASEEDRRQIVEERTKREEQHKNLMEQQKREDEERRLREEELRKNAEENMKRLLAAGTAKVANEQKQREADEDKLRREQREEYEEKRKVQDQERRHVEHLIELGLGTPLGDPIEGDSPTPSPIETTKPDQHGVEAGQNKLSTNSVSSSTSSESVRSTDSVVFRRLLAQSKAEAIAEKERAAANAAKAKEKASREAIERAAAAARAQTYAAKLEEASKKVVNVQKVENAIAPTTYVAVDSDDELPQKDLLTNQKVDSVEDEKKPITKEDTKPDVEVIRPSVEEDTKPPVQDAKAPVNEDTKPRTDEVAKTRETDDVAPSAQPPAKPALKTIQYDSDSSASLSSSTTTQSSDSAKQDTAQAPKAGTLSDLRTKLALEKADTVAPMSIALISKAKAASAMVSDTKKPTLPNVGGNKPKPEPKPRVSSAVGPEAKSEVSPLAQVGVNKLETEPKSKMSPAMNPLSNVGVKDLKQAGAVNPPQLETQRQADGDAIHPDSMGVVGASLNIAKPSSNTEHMTSPSREKEPSSLGRAKNSPSSSSGSSNESIPAIRFDVPANRQKFAKFYVITKPPDDNPKLKGVFFCEFSQLEKCTKVGRLARSGAEWKVFKTKDLAEKYFEKVS